MPKENVKGKHPGTVYDVLADVHDRVSQLGWEIVYPSEPRRDQRQLMETFGVAVVVDPSRPAGVVQSAPMEVAAHEATATRDCKQPGCDEAARYDRGAGAGYCEAHGRPLFQAVAQASNDARRRRNGHRPAESLEERVRALAPQARRVERAAQRRQDARGKVAEADERFQAELAEFKAAAADLLRAVQALAD